MAARLRDLNNRSLQRLPFTLLNNRTEVWATVLFLSTIMHRKVMHVNSVIFFVPYLVDNGLLKSRNFAARAM